MKHMVTTNQNPIGDIQEMKRKKSKHSTIKSHQYIREQENTKGTEQNYKKIRKQLIKWQ